MKTCPFTTCAGSKTASLSNRLDLDVVRSLFTIFAAIALVLASVGLYAVIAHSVSQRTREIGLRMAMGGTARDIVTLVFAQGYAADPAWAGGRTVGCVRSSHVCCAERWSACHP